MSETPYTPSLLRPEECKHLFKSQKIPEKEHKKRGLKQEMIIKDKGRKAKIPKERAGKDGSNINCGKFGFNQICIY